MSPPLIFAQRLRGTLVQTLRGLMDHQAFDIAAAMAFQFFLGLMPLLAFLGYLLGHIALQTGVDWFINPLAPFLPESVATVLRQELTRMGTASEVAPLSVLGFVYITSSGTHNFMDVLETISGAPPRTWMRQRLIALAWNVLSLVVFTMFTWFLLQLLDFHPFAAFQKGPRYLLRLLPTLTLQWARKLLFAGLLCGASVGGLGLFFRIAVKHPPHIHRRVWPGAIVGVLLSIAVSSAYGFYVSTLGRYAYYYGGLATVAVTMIWLYLASLSLLVGAEVNAHLEGLRTIDESAASFYSTPALKALGASPPESPSPAPPPCDKALNTRNHSPQ